MVQLAELYSRFRDWERVDALFDEVGTLDVSWRPWHRVERATVFENQDRLDDAYAEVEACLHEAPWYRPAVQMKAYLLEESGEFDEAIQLLEESMAHIEYAPIAFSLLRLINRHRPESDLTEYVGRFRHLQLVKDDDYEQALLRLRCDDAIEKRDHPAAVELSKQCTGLFFESVCERLEASDAIEPPVDAGVPFVRQDYRTCGPATLDALCRYWGEDAQQANIIEEIWFDGTSDFLERRWAQQQGYVVREFRLTWDATRTLLDGGVPFALATVETTSAHMQVVAGLSPDVRDAGASRPDSSVPP